MNRIEVREKGLKLFSPSFKSHEMPTQVTVRIFWHQNSASFGKGIFSGKRGPAKKRGISDCQKSECTFQKEKKKRGTDSTSESLQESPSKVNSEEKGNTPKLVRSKVYAHRISRIEKKRPKVIFTIIPRLRNANEPVRIFWHQNFTSFGKGIFQGNGALPKKGGSLIARRANALFQK